MDRVFEDRAAAADRTRKKGILTELREGDVRQRKAPKIESTRLN